MQTAQQKRERDIGFEVVGASASAFIVVAWVPQLVQLYESKNIAGLNEWLFFLTGLGNALLALYGGIKNAPAVVVTGTLVAASAFIVFIGIVIFRISQLSSSSSSSSS